MIHRVLARAPSNIALVKYMGKKDEAKNLPENPSLSLTLSSLCSWVELRPSTGSSDRWIAERPEGILGDLPILSAQGEEKFLRHFARIRERAPALLKAQGLMPREDAGAADIRSVNTFPAAAGIASSASSFAALTLAGVAFFSNDREAFREKYAIDSELRQALASLSREGSGSSARSFDGPFIAWNHDRTERITSALPLLSDLVVVVSAEAKSVGSSEAHRRVRTSPSWSGRVERATRRYGDLRTSLADGNFQRVIEIADEDYKDMHQLFETANPPFHYRNDGTRTVLDFVGKFGGCITTLDAGPNVHVIVPQPDAELWRKRLIEQFPEYPLLVDREGSGAELVEERR